MLNHHCRLIYYSSDKYIIQRLNTFKEGPLLDEFVRLYRPEYETLTQILDIELYQYIQAAAKDYLKKKGNQ